MLNATLQLLLDVFVQGFAYALLLRFLLQWLRAPMRNPAGDALMSLTNFVVLPARRYIPAIWQLDSATLLLALCVELLYLTLILGLQSPAHTAFPLLGLLLGSVVKLLVMSVHLLMGALIAQAVLSWVNPYTPLAPLLHAVTQRFLRPIQRAIPPLGQLDLSTLILLVICQILLLVPLAMLENIAAQ